MQDVHTRMRLAAPFTTARTILQIQIPTALGDVVRVADPVAELRPASAHFTYFRHNRRSLGLSSSLSSSGLPPQPI